MRMICSSRFVRLAGTWWRLWIKSMSLSTQKHSVRAKRIELHGGTLTDGEVDEMQFAVRDRIGEELSCEVR